MTHTRDEAIQYLTGALTGGGRPDAVGKKFTPQGAPIPCPGYTTICHVDQSSDAFAALVAAQDALKAGPLADAFTFLPPASFHMTIFEGVIDYARSPERWPRHLPLDMPVDAVTEDALARLQGLDLPHSFAARPTGIFAGFSVEMTGADDAAEATLRRTRDRLRAASNILRPDHVDYQFHITLGYLLRWLTRDEAEVVVDLSDTVAEALLQRVAGIALGEVELCSFESMHHFETLRRLD